MNKNTEIKQNLQKKLNKYLDLYQSIQSKEPIFDRLLAELESFDFELYKKNVHDEIKVNLIEWWTNTEKGIIPSEELFAILFEYGYFLQKGVDAPAYGIGEWKNFEIQTDEFDMGFDYDFTTEFYASPGITLNFFDPLEILDHNELKYKYKDIEEFDGYDEIIQLFKVKGMIAIHEVLEKLDKEGTFNTLNCKDNFMFLINEHDTGDVFPLFVKSKLEQSSSGTQITEQNQEITKRETIFKQSKKWWEIWK